MSTEVEDVPEDWNKGGSTGGKYLNKDAFEGGIKVDLQIVQGPKAFGVVGVPFGSKPWDLPDPKEAGKTRKRYSVKVPFGTEVAGQQVKTNYIFEVIMLSGPEAGAHKVWEVGPQIKGQLQESMTVQENIKKSSFRVYKTTKGEKTEWKAQRIGDATTPEDQLKPQFVLVNELYYATKEELEAIPAPNRPVTKVQLQKIQDLAGAKDMTPDGLDKMVKRKFGKDNLDGLSSGQAQELIDALSVL
jgi:LysM repeat protein